MADVEIITSRKLPLESGLINSFFSGENFSNSTKFLIRIFE